jgi:ribosome assembly protein 4
LSHPVCKSKDFSDCLPAASTRQRVDVVRANEAVDAAEAVHEHKVMCQLVDESGAPTGSQVLLPASANAKQLDELLSTMFEDEEQRSVPYAFFVGGEQVTDTVMKNLHTMQKDAFVEKQLKEGRRVRPQDVEQLPFHPPEEIVVSIMYKPQAVFRVRPVTRCSATLDGHSEAVLIVSFSPDSRVLATGGGDKEIRIWDIFTNTPTDVLQGHNGWVQVLSWSPNSKFLVSGSRDGTLLSWKHDGDYGNFKSQKYKAHTNYVTHVAWEPLHRNVACDRFVSASKDATMKVWRVGMGLQFCLSGHQSCVSCVKWGGGGRIYSSSQDKTLMVWDDSNGAGVCSLRGHAHWVNFIALSTDLVMRTGAFDHEDKQFDSPESAQAHAQKRYDGVVSRFGGTERLVSCSDDNTLFLWNPQKTTSAVGGLTGHQGAVFHLQFSPDGTMIASCGADKSVKLWNANDGKFITTFRGHVAAVYHVSWSLDSRMLVSGSRDSTLKLWSVATKELVEDLSGHEDEIFSTDWSPDGQRVATGSKDKKVRIWVH